MTIKGGTSQACAACKFQRRRCYSDCQLAPYFPPDQPKLFQNAHRLFGVRNILRIIKKLEPGEKEEAMRSILYESFFRDKFPVQGCLGFIYTLLFQIQQLQLELDNLNSHLALFRGCSSSNPAANSPPPTSSYLLPAPPGHLRLDDTSIPLFHAEETEQDDENYHAFDSKVGQVDENYCAFNSTSLGMSLVDEHECKVDLEIQDGSSNGRKISDKLVNLNDAMWAQKQHSYMISSANHSTFIGSSSKATNGATVHGIDEICPYFATTIDDQQSYIESKERYESSSESSLGDTMECWNNTMESMNGSMESMKDTMEIKKGKMQLMENVPESDLKSAAASFKLTSER